MTQIIDGKALAAELCAQVKQEVAALGFVPGLAVVQVGDRPASEVYVRNKLKTAREAGFDSFRRHLPAEIPEAALLAEIEALNRMPNVHGILVQLPLPAYISEQAVIHAIAPQKDVDGFHPINIGKLWMGDADALVPCTPLGCVLLLKAAGVQLAGKHAVVLGRSNIVGKPMAALLLREHCTVTIAHSRTENLADAVRGADIVIAAVGKPELVRGSWIKPGAAVIDVGINRIPQEGGKDRLIGDVAFAECLGLAGALTPVPGGVGPMTIACLLKNTLMAAKAGGRVVI